MEDIEKQELLPRKKAELEALLFYYGEAIARNRIAKLLEIKPKECDVLLESFKEELTNESRGITLLFESETVRLVTKPEVRAVCERIVKEEFREALTPAALETLAIIAYLGPIPRATVDYIRGVNSSFTVRALLMRGLVDRAHDEERSNVFLYRASGDFLAHMGLTRIEDLPEYEKFKNVLHSFELRDETAVQ